MKKNVTGPSSKFSAIILHYYTFCQVLWLVLVISTRNCKFFLFPTIENQNRTPKHDISQYCY